MGSLLAMSDWHRCKRAARKRNYQRGAARVVESIEWAIRSERRAMIDREWPEINSAFVTSRS
jgi:transcriptional regulator of acetoin/glycerol metabolism